jgi:hypothetical protein
MNEPIEMLQDAIVKVGVMRRIVRAKENFASTVMMISLMIDSVRGRKWD